MNETDYNARLYEKMKAEQDKYRDRLLHPYELMTTICTSGIAAILYASLLKKWSLMEVKLNLSINPNRQKTRPETEKNSDKEVQE